LVNYRKLIENDNDKRLKICGLIFQFVLSAVIIVFYFSGRIKAEYTLEDPSTLLRLWVNASLLAIIIEPIFFSLFVPW